ncbi:MAG: adenosine deaminase [Thermodesulfobacteriota bacterium]|nr:adenosine deaminase [Thermodesulfobacteriota bacterium]
MLYNEFIEGESPNIAQLNLFFSKMPKGGDIHHHYSGSVYAETYLDWVEVAGYWIDKNALQISKVKTSSSISVEQLRSKTGLYRKLLTLWGDKDYQNHYHLQPPPDANFFNTFGYFGPISGFSYNKGLMILKERAIKENVSYIETMFKSVGYSYSDQTFDENIRKATSTEAISFLLDKLSSKIDKDNVFQEKIDGFVRLIKKAHEDIDDDQFMMRYQTYATRNNSPSVVFSALYSAFKAAETSELIVGVNIVGPENGVVAIADYNLHMQMFAYLKKKFPSVNRALHAGELTLGMVRPKSLRFHISQAIDIAGAQRIGHGVDLPYEKGAIDLLQRIKEKSVVEINFTSNEFILGVKGRDHPYLIYSAYDVPIVICTDDSGVSRNNLSSEYVLLATRYKPGYKTVKKYVYNSIKYSFLSESDKDLLTNSLDVRFEKFEAEMAKYSDLILK